MCVFVCVCVEECIYLWDSNDVYVRVCVCVCVSIWFWLMLSECVHVCVSVSLHVFGLSVHSSLVLYVCVMSMSSFCVCMGALDLF